MAIFHLSVSVVKRATGANAVAAYAYQSGQRAKNERTGETYDYARKERVLSNHNFVPADAPEEFKSDPLVWINSLEKYEKGENAQIAKKINVALPREMTTQQHEQVLSEFIQKNFTEKGYCAICSIHNDHENNNPHAHILISDRALKNGKWASVKQKKVLARDEEGNKIPVLDAQGKQKTRIRAGKGEEKIWQRITVDNHPLSIPGGVEAVRADWAAKCNNLLPENKKIDHRSHARRGLKALPQIHVGAAGMQMRDHSSRWVENERRKELNSKIRGLEEKIERARGVAYVCASFADAAVAAGGEQKLFKALLDSKGWKKYVKDKPDKSVEKKRLKKTIKAGGKATVIVSVKGGQVAASVVKVSANVLKNTLGNIPIIGTPIKIAASAIEGGAEAAKSGLGRVEDAMVRKDQQGQRQRLQERQREQEPPEPEEKESGSAGSGSAPQMRDTDALDELLKYTDYAMLSQMEKEEVRAKQVRSEV